METYRLKIGDINNLAIGSSLLGSGGGGDPYIGVSMLKNELEKRKTDVEIIIGINELNKNEYLVSTAMMGATTISIEKPPNGNEVLMAMRTYIRIAGKNISYITPVEVGGENSITPLISSLKTGIPVLDGDGMGRAFPELQMTTFYFYGISPSPLVLVDERDNVSVIYGIDGLWSERIARAVTLRYGGSSYVISYGMSLRDYATSYIPNTLSLSIEIGELLNEHKLDEVLDKLHGVILFKGKIVDVWKGLDKGFNKGYVLIEGLDEYKNMNLRVHFQNEFIVAIINESVAASAPDIISLLDLFSLKPITTDRVKYGQKVIVVGIPAHEKLKTEKALKYVGPKAFGYNIEYSPLTSKKKLFL
ncbi:MAG: DUF917 domain-containing protein [Sulfolobus sp.]